jgi:uncharacterized protein (TIGR04255 family)
LSLAKGDTVIIGHPRFPNPTIQEALCEIHFCLRPGLEWDASFFGKFYRQVESDFPDFEPAPPAGLQVQLTSGQIGFLPPQSRVRYKHATRQLVLQLGENMLTINTLAKYEGWAQMKADILQAWTWAQEALVPAAITRLGLRYINLIPRQSAEEKVGDWLAPNDYVATSVLGSNGGFLSRVEAYETPTKRIVVTLAEAQSDAHRPIVVDMDCINENADGNSLDLQLSLEELHETVWTVFLGFMTPRLHQLLQGGAK